MTTDQPQALLLEVIRTQLQMEAAMTPRRPGDERSLGMMDCPVWLLQEWQESGGEEDGHWQVTEGAWFTHAEAEAWGRACEYRLGKWRVYGVGARGELKTLLKAHTDYP